MSAQKPTRRQFLVFGVAPVAMGSALRAQAQSQKTPPNVTPAQVEGPFYRPDAPYRRTLWMDDADGQRLIVAGTVRAHPGGAPLPGAVLDVWQSNHLGHYDNEQPGYDATKYSLRGKIRTDGRGWYEFETIVPANYLLGPDTPQLRASTST